MECSLLRNVFSNISRKRPLESDEDLYQTPLERSLTTTQLILMGLGAMIGAGLYVLTGVEAKEVTGPAIIVSYSIAAIAAFFSAFCYVEFACRVPKTGSAYTFTYIAVGEMWAFLIGWNLILEYAISAASVSTSFIGYLDSLTGYVLQNFTINTIMGGTKWNVSFLAPYPDIFSALLLILITLFIITGAKVSSIVNGIFIIINIVVIGIIVILGFVKADIKNWQDYGGFVPNGAGSIIAGAATLFFSFVGFDSIAVANEETVDPRSSIPRATFISILIASICYILSSAVLTLMVPYTNLDETSAFADAFAQQGIEWARWMVGIGALSAMFTSILMSLYCLPRSIYAMAADGLLFSWLSNVNRVTKVPIYAALFSMFLCVIPALFFTLSQLVEFLSIGVLLGYTFVAGAVILLRYRPDNLQTDDRREGVEMKAATETTNVGSSPDSLDSTYHSRTDERKLLEKSSVVVPGTLKLRYHSTPILRELARFKPGLAVKLSLCASIFFQICALGLVEYASDWILAAEWWAIMLLCFLILCTLLTFSVIPLHNQTSDDGAYYRVPWVPFFPWLAILCNVTLVLKLTPITWLRFLVWVVVGLIIYASYGYWHSKVGRIPRQRLQDENREGDNSRNRSKQSGGKYGSTHTAK